MVWCIDVSWPVADIYEKCFCSQETTAVPPPVVITQKDAFILDHGGSFAPYGFHCKAIVQKDGVCGLAEIQHNGDSTVVSTLSLSQLLVLRVHCIMNPLFHIALIPCSILQRNRYIIQNHCFY